MSSAAAFPAGLHAKGFSVKGGGQLVIYCCNKHWQANDSILCCVLLAVLFILPRDFWLYSVLTLGGGGSKWGFEFCKFTVFYKRSTAYVREVILHQKLFGFVKKVNPLHSYLL